MISIVTSYYNRKQIFIRTLNSIKSQLDIYKNPLEVIVVDDGSDAEERLEDLVVEFPFLKIVRLEKENKWYKNSCIPFNIGFRHAKGEKIIFQNPECFHYGNILEFVENNLQESVYLSFACYSLGIESTDNFENLIREPLSLKNLMEKNNQGYIGDGLDCWYNHSVIRPAGYHFCCAITKRDLYDLGGFDERFAQGVAYDDNEILYRIKLKGMKIEIIDTPIVFHQNHYQKPSSLNNVSLMDKKSKKLRHQLVERNRIFFEEITQKTPSWKVNILDSIVEDKDDLKSKILNFFRQ